MPGLPRIVVAATALALVVLTAVASPQPAAAEGWTTPSLARTIGGTGRTSLFPWGLAWNPVAERYVVTDYFNYQVREYDADWQYTGTLPQPSAATGDPESVLAAVAVDPRNGDMYVAKPKPDTLAHYDAAGHRLDDVVVSPGSGAQTYTAWLDIDRDGYLYVLDSHLWNTADHPSRLIKLAPGGGPQVAAWDLSFPHQQPGQFYGIDVGADGQVYVSDSINRRLLVLSADGTLVRTMGTSAGPDVVGGLSGDLRDVLVDDATGRVYVSDALQNQVEVFAADGTPLFHLGGEGTAPGQLIGPSASWRSARTACSGSPSTATTGSRPSTPRPAPRSTWSHAPSRSGPSDSSASRATSRSTRRPGTCGSPTRGTSGSAATPGTAPPTAAGAGAATARRTA